MKKLIIFLISLITVLAVIPLPGVFASYNAILDDKEKMTLYSEIIYLETIDDKTVIFDKNANVRTSPASFCKLVAAGVVMEKCDNLDSFITVSKEALRGYGNTFKEGESVRVTDLLYCSLLLGENDAVNILAYHFGGTKEGFVKMMNNYAKSAGCKNTNFANPQGYDAEGQYTTAADAAKIMRKIYSSDKASILETIVSTRNYTVPATDMSKERGIYNKNSMLSPRSEYYCKGVSGTNVGYTSEAGNCVAAKATRNGYSYYAVIMKGPSKHLDSDSDKENCAMRDCRTVLNWAFKNIKFTELVKQSQVIAEIKVNHSADTDSVALSSSKSLNLFVPSNIEAGSVLIEPIDMPESINAPVNQGDFVCKASVKYAGKELAQIELVAQEEASVSSFLFIGENVKALFKLTAVKVILVILLLLVLG